MNKEERDYYENEQFEQSMYEYMFDLEEINNSEGGIEVDND